MDRLRSESVRFTDFHVTPMCTPTRSQLMNRARLPHQRRHERQQRPDPVKNRRADHGGDLCRVRLWHRASSESGIWATLILSPDRPRISGVSLLCVFAHRSAPDAWNNDYFSDKYRHNGPPAAVRRVLHGRILRGSNELDPRPRAGKAARSSLTCRPTRRTVRCLCRRNTSSPMPGNRRRLPRSSA